MITLNSWFDDLVNEGYTSGTVNDRLHAFLGDQGHTGTINDRLNAWLGSKGYTGVLGERLAKALRDGVVPEPPAPPCSANLTGDIITTFGIAAMETIQSDFAETVSPGEQRGVTAPYFKVDWTGSRTIEFDVTADNGDCTITFYEIVGGTPSVVEQAGSLDAASLVTVIVRSNGEVSMLIDGAEVAGTPGSIGDTANDCTIGGINGDASFGSMSLTAYTNADNITHGEDADWCGNEI